MDQKEHPIRQIALDAIKKVHWVPEWGESRITGMISNRPDWCLSRQRLWGVPIPVFYCEQCSHIYQSVEAMHKVADAIEQAEDPEGGLEAYWSQPVSAFLPSGLKCSQCGCKDFRKGKDILDVWFDSGVCWAAVQKKYPEMTYPADLYLEGSDQHRGWFHTSLLTSVAVEKKPPFKGVLTHGFVMFSKGVKMSKSQGNVVDPQDIIKEKGAELLRLWTIHEDYTQDVSSSPEIFDRLTETYRRIRNTMRFLLGNLHGFVEEETLHEVPYKELLELDQWILHKLNNLVDEVGKAYEAYTFHKIYHLLNNFFNVELSALYLDIIKDRLYTSQACGKERRSAQTALFYLADVLIRLMAPVLSFLSEEVYGFLPHGKESVFLTAFPKYKKDWERKDLEEKYTVLLTLREKISKKIEDLRKQKQVRSSLEVKIELLVNEPALAHFLISNKAELTNFFIVSEVILKHNVSIDIKKEPFVWTSLLEDMEKAQVVVSKAEGSKCARCWHLSREIDASKGLCPRCVAVLA